MAFFDEVATTVRLDDITRQAREVRFWRSVATFVAALLFGVGWLAARAFVVVWFVLAWSAVAVKVGWAEGRGRRGPA